MDLTVLRQGDLCQLVLAGAPDRTDFRYVWDFWDGEVQTTIEPAIDKVINRTGSLPVVVTVVGPRGQSQQFSFTVQGLAGPQFTGIVEPASSFPVPRVISLAAESTDPNLPITGTWTDQTGAVVATGPYLSQTTQLDSVKLTYTAVDNIGTTTSLDFDVESQTGLRPTVGEIGLVVSGPIDGGSYATVDAAFLTSVNFLGNQPIAGGPVLPVTQALNQSGVWTPIQAGVAIVGGQLSSVDNGVYNVDSAELAITYDSGLLANPLTLPQYDIYGYETQQLLLAKLLPGTQAQLSNSTGYVNFLALDVIAGSGAEVGTTAVGWLNIESAGSLNQAQPVLFQTRWSRSSLAVSPDSLWYDNTGKTFYQAELDKPLSLWQTGVDGVQFYPYDLSQDLTPGKLVRLECGVKCQTVGVTYTWTLPDGVQVNGVIDTTDLVTIDFEYTIPLTIEAGNTLNLSLAVTDPRYPSLPITRLASVSVVSS